MKLNIQFKQHNEKYDQDYADEYHGGEESENNWKYKWASGYEVEDVVSFDFKENQSETFLANTPNEKKEIVVENFVVLECLHNDGKITRFGVSKSILKSFHQTKGEKHKKMYAYFYINGESEYVPVGDSFYIDINAIPNSQDN